MNRGGTNPVFNRVQRETESVQGYGASYKGIIFKTVFLLLVTIASGIGSLFLAAFSPTVYMVIFAISGILGFVSVMVASFSTRLAPAFSVVYAVCEGVILGIITLLYAASFPETNIVGLAVLITIGVFIGMLVLYSTKLIVASTRFRRVMYGISFSILAVFLVVGIASIFGGGVIWFTLFGDVNSPIVLFLALLLVFYGAFMLVINFDNANMLVSQGVDKKYEWVVSLGLIVSILYIYVQVLRLLAILLLRNND